jgi:lipopolysaccharide export system permease protein
MNRVFVHLGLLNDWSAFFSTVIPTLLFLIAGLVMLVMVERR